MGFKERWIFFWLSGKGEWARPLIINDRKNADPNPKRRRGVVVEQEMAQIYPPSAEELAQFLPESDCGACGFESCVAFSAALLGKKTSAHQCPDLDEEFKSMLAVIVDLTMDPIPYNIMMEQHPCNLIEIHEPDDKSPLLVTANFRETVSILKGILEATSTRAFLLPTFTHGYSVDNAVAERMFKAVEVLKAMKENYVEQRIERPVLIIPGLAESERNSIRQMTRCNVLVGPVSGFLTPLFVLAQRDEIF
jgi:CO dehydrogenase/acetyl-CoA synthase gamma subunit (corrinoid Fe-S protein)